MTLANLVTAAENSRKPNAYDLRRFEDGYCHLHFPPRSHNLQYVREYHPSHFSSCSHELQHLKEYQHIPSYLAAPVIVVLSQHSNHHLERRTTSSKCNTLGYLTTSPARVSRSQGMHAYTRRLRGPLDATTSSKCYTLGYLTTSPARVSHIRKLKRPFDTRTVSSKCNTLSSLTTSPARASYSQRMERIHRKV